MTFEITSIDKEMMIFYKFLNLILKRVIIMKKLFYPLLLLTAMTSTAVISAENKPFTFYNIVPFAAGKEALTAKDMIEYQQITGNDIVLYSLTTTRKASPPAKKPMNLLPVTANSKKSCPAARSNWAY